MANSLPFLSGLDLFVTLDEEGVNLAPQLIDDDVSFTDADNNFDGGTLVLSGLLAEDIVGIRNQGNYIGQIGVDGANITYEGVVIGTVSGGTGGVALSVTFNAQANASSIDVLIENLTFRNLSDDPAFERTLELTITDAAGAYAVAPVGGIQELNDVANPFNGIWVGNFNRPAFADLDGDGDLDVVSGCGGELQYLENTGTDIAPVYVERNGPANPFNGIPLGFYTSPSLADLDGDGDLDVVTGEHHNVLWYIENTGTDVAPAYFLHTGTANPFNGIDAGIHPAPALADLDGDGDFDVVSGEYHGKFKYYENTGSTVTPVYVERTGAANPFNGIDVGSYSAPVFADLDGDGDLDAVIGERAGNFNYYENTGTGVVPAYVERTGAANPFNGLDAGIYSTPAVADVDGDGDLDMVSGERFGDFKYYENIGPQSALGDASFVSRTGAANPFDGIDISSYSAPTFADLDDDGDLDAVIGTTWGTPKYYENTGTDIAPVYVERTGTADPFGAIAIATVHTPSLVDLDDDGDLDAVIGEFHGTINYYENTGTGSAPVYLQRTGEANPFDGIDIGYYSAPSISDLDSDGDLDAMIGEYLGTLKYYENTGTGVAPVYVERTGVANPFDGIDVGLNSTPTFADLDGDGDLDVVSGEYFGTIKYYENTGTGVAPVYVERTGEANPFDGIDVGESSTPSFADLDGDGDLDAVIGEVWGTLKYYENTGPTGFNFVLTVTPHADSSAGDDVINGTDGDDTVDAQDGDDSIVGGYGNDTISGGAGADRGYGNVGDDSLTGGDGNDTLFGGQGNDAVAGDAGDDNIQGNLGDDAVGGGDGNDTLLGNWGIDTLLGGAGADKGLGNQGDDTLLGGAGNDTFLHGGQGDDWVFGNAGDDQVYGGLGSDNLYGGQNNDVLSGGEGADYAEGNLGDDTISGDAGSDTLSGGAGNDSMVGGAGIDHYRYDAMSLNTGEVAANQADIIDAAAGDLISMLGLTDELTIGGEALSALTADVAVGTALSSGDTNIAFVGGVLQIDLDGINGFEAANDFQIALSGVTTVTFSEADDLFHLS